jgi:hypothetical protein
MTLLLHIPSYPLLFAASIILLYNAFATRRKTSLTPLEWALLVGGIVLGAIGSLSFLEGTDFIIPFIWRVVILAGGAIIIIVSFFLHRSRTGSDKPLYDSQVQATSPSINYGRIIVKNTTRKMHGGTYDERHYYVEISNDVPKTVAQGCRGSLNISTEQGSHTMIWEDGSVTAKIGHTALLYLFEVDTFEKESERTRSFLYFHWEDHIVNDESEQSYKKSLKVFIQSDNAQFPSNPSITLFVNL